ncbi:MULTISPECIES: hypothetical protein [unclassified Variovorax]|uniref:hypothetical protein n=1 Tax=unclassified Variovorax TaxID=663243 RepID=UPI00076D0050|nr:MULTISPECIES: hypothetical protein [unclassified Variovorax]KWT73956.1 hypothetical protein APY03_5807 [Variovorax sp. WDL1]
MSHLRHLSVWVDEPDPGRFFWVLHESTEDASVWVDMESSAESFVSWMEAFNAGCIALVRQVPDEQHGPRAAGEDEDAAPVG